MENKTKYIEGCDPYTKDGITEPPIEILSFSELTDEFNDWKASQKRMEIAKEIQKCKDDPYHFFTIYCTINGEKVGTRYTREEFESLFAKITANFLISRRK